jgi:twitching motility two-component system response regulator PilG
VLVIDDSNTIRRSAEIFLAARAATRWCWPKTVSTPWPRSTTMRPSDLLRHPDAAPGWLPNLRHHQAQSEVRQHVPVIMLSSKDGLFDKARGRMVGSQDYLTKPFTKDQLLQAVAQYGG